MDSTHVEVTISPPSVKRWEARELLIFWEPPRGMGQPTVCPAIPRTSPNAAVGGFSRGQNEWALNPANKTLAGRL